MDLRLRSSHSLKDRRQAVKPVVDGARRRFGVAAAETGHHDAWQRAEVAFSAVGDRPGHVTEVLDAVERFVWSFPDVEVLATARGWVDPEHLDAAAADEPRWD